MQQVSSSQSPHLPLLYGFPSLRRKNKFAATQTRRTLQVLFDLNNNKQSFSRFDSSSPRQQWPTQTTSFGSFEKATVDKLAAQRVTQLHLHMLAGCGADTTVNSAAVSGGRTTVWDNNGYLGGERIFTWAPPVVHRPGEGLWPSSGDLVLGENDVWFVVQPRNGNTGQCHVHVYAHFKHVLSTHTRLFCCSFVCLFLCVSVCFGLFWGFFWCVCKSQKKTSAASRRCREQLWRQCCP